MEQLETLEQGRLFLESFETDPYASIRIGLAPHNATLLPHQVSSLLGPMPAAVVLYQIFREPDIRHAFLRGLLHRGPDPTARSHRSFSRRLLSLSDLCRLVAEQSEASAGGSGSFESEAPVLAMEFETPRRGKGFHVDQMPVAVQTRFANAASSAWPSVVNEAIAHGIRNTKWLADMIFFMNHKERVAGGVGKIIDASEPEFVKLRAEWILHEIIAQRRLNPSFACSPFLKPKLSNDYEAYVNAPTTGRMSLLINGRSGNQFQVEAFNQMQQAVELLEKGDSLYLAAFMLNPTNLTAPAKGMTTWNDLLVAKAAQGVKIRILITAELVPGPGWKSDLASLDHSISLLPTSLKDNLKYVVSLHPAVIHGTYNPVTKIARIVASGFPFHVGTHHQKFMVVKSRRQTIAFCGGLDISPQRVPQASSSFVWHDTHARLEGKIVHDIEREFVLRWNREKDKSTVPLQPGWAAMENLSLPTSPVIDMTPAKNPHQLQMLRTVSVGTTPSDIRRDDVWQSYFRLIGCATRFLILENQYFHERVMADAIAAQMEAQPGLIVLIVVSGETDDPDNFLTANGQAQQNEFFDHLLGRVTPDRVRVFSMKGRLVHSKLIMVDDQMLSMGSTNADPRDFFMDTQMNIVLNSSEAVNEFRTRQWAHNLGVPATVVAGWKVADFLSNWDRVARSNEALQGTPDKMQGEAIIRFDPRSIKGKRSRDIDLLTEVSLGHTAADLV